MVVTSVKCGCESDQILWWGLGELSHYFLLQVSSWWDKRDSVVCRWNAIISNVLCDLCSLSRCENTLLDVLWAGLSQWTFYSCIYRKTVGVSVHCIDLNSWDAPNVGSVHCMPIKTPCVEEHHHLMRHCLRCVSQVCWLLVSGFSTATDLNLPSLFQLDAKQTDPKLIVSWLNVPCRRVHVSSRPASATHTYYVGMRVGDLQDFSHLKILCLKPLINIWLI